MVEIYADVRDEVRKMASVIWTLAFAQKDPHKIAQFLLTMIDYYKEIYTEEEIEFLQFYFQTQMEMMKK